MASPTCASKLSIARLYAVSGTHRSFFLTIFPTRLPGIEREGKSRRSIGPTPERTRKQGTRQHALTCFDSVSIGFPPTVPQYGSEIRTFSTSHRQAVSRALDVGQQSYAVLLAARETEGFPIVGGDDPDRPRRHVPRRRLASQSESGGRVSPSEPTAGAVHVAPLSRRERARHHRPQTM